MFLMFRKYLNFIKLVAVVCSYLFIAPLQASLINNVSDFSGVLKMNISSGASIGGIYNTSCDGIADCDATQVNTVTHGLTNEDSWGVFSIDKLTNHSGSEVIWTESVGDYLVGIFGGLIDIRAEVSSLGQTTFSENGWLKLYSVSSLDMYNDILDDINLVVRNLSGEVDGISNAGRLMLDGTFDGAASTDPLEIGAYQSNFNSNTSELTGIGFADVTGGVFLPHLSGGTQLDNKLDFQDIGFSIKNDTGAGPGSSGWTTYFGGRVTTTAAVPEPASLGLLAIFILGLTQISRSYKR